MREIKFRGKRLDDGEWVTGYLIADNCIRVYKSVIDDDGYEDCLDYDIMVDKNTVGQDTGIVDKNGTEIYEGDIIVYNNNAYRNLIAVVKQKDV